MSYKMVLDLGKLCGSLAGSAIENRDLILASLTELWSDRLAEGEIPNLLQIQTFIAEDLIDADALADASRHRADRAGAKAARRLPAMADLLVSLCRAAGEERLAARVRAR